MAAACVAHNIIKQNNSICCGLIGFFSARSLVSAENRIVPLGQIVTLPYVIHTFVLRSFSLRQHFWVAIFLPTKPKSKNEWLLWCLNVDSGLVRIPHQLHIEQKSRKCHECELWKALVKFIVYSGSISSVFFERCLVMSYIEIEIKVMHLAWSTCWNKLTKNYTYLCGLKSQLNSFLDAAQTAVTKHIVTNCVIREHKARCMRRQHLFGSLVFGKLHGLM